MLICVPQNIKQGTIKCCKPFNCFWIMEFWLLILKKFVHIKLCKNDWRKTKKQKSVFVINLGATDTLKVFKHLRTNTHGLRYTFFSNNILLGLRTIWKQFKYDFFCEAREQIIKKWAPNCFIFQGFANICCYHERELNLKPLMIWEQLKNNVLSPNKFFQW